MNTPETLADFGLAIVIPANISDPPQLVCYRQESLLETLYWAIQCSLVDVVRCTDNRLTKFLGGETGTDIELCLWVDDEGAIGGRQARNLRYATLAAEFGLPHQRLYGPVVITGGADEEGNTVGLTQELATRLFAVINPDETAED